MASQKLTEYERLRLENIKRNDEMLAALKVHARATELSAAAKRQKVSTKSYKLSPQKKAKTETPVVIRRSLRTRGLPPDGKGLPDNFDERLVKSNPNVEPKPKFSPRNEGPIAISDAYYGSDSCNALIKVIQGLSKENQIGGSLERSIEEENGALLSSGSSTIIQENLMGDAKEERVDEPFEGELKMGLKSCEIKKDGSLTLEKENIEESIDGGTKKLFASGKMKKEDGAILNLGSLTLKEENVARVVPGRIMPVKFVPTSQVRMVAVGSKFGNVGFWNMDSKEEEGDGIFVYQLHSGPVCGISFAEFDISKMFTCCYDGFVRMMDVEKEVFDLIYSSDEAIFALSQHPNDINCLCLGEGRGGLNIWDYRAGKSSASWTLHEKRINTIDFNKQMPFMMATSSSDGTACIWDLRSMDSTKPKAIRVVKHKRAVSAAYFSPSGQYLATTSFDDKVGIVSGENFEKTSMVYHDNQTGQWISPFRAIWGWDDSYIFIGNMTRAVDVISPTLLRQVEALRSPCMSAIPCRFDAHPLEVGLLAAATSGGQVYAWTTT